MTTGCAAPVFVPGAIAAISADSQNKKSGRRGAAAAGSDINYDGYRRVRNLLDDLAGGFDPALPAY